jgi:hypothetical protein
MHFLEVKLKVARALDLGSMEVKRSASRTSRYTPQIRESGYHWEAGWTRSRSGYDEENVPSSARYPVGQPSGRQPFGPHGPLNSQF